MKPQPSLCLQQQMSQLQQKFRGICLKYGASISYSDLIFSSSAQSHNADQQEDYKIKVYLLADEINLLKKGQSAFQTISALLEEREAVLRSLRQKLIGNRNHKPDEVAECCEELALLRMYSLTIIEQSAALLRKISIAGSKYTTQIFGQLWLSMEFLRTTPLRKDIQFSNTPDPLLLIPLKKYSSVDVNKQHRAVAELFSVDSNYLARLLKADKTFRCTINDFQGNKANSLTQNQHQQGEQQSKQCLKSESTKRKKRQGSHNLRLPLILAKDRLQIGSNSQHSYSINGLIQDYQSREKIKRSHDRLIFNEIKTKKRAATHANQYPQPKQRYKLAKQQVKSKLLYIDEDNNDEPDSQIQLSLDKLRIKINGVQANQSKQPMRVPQFSAVQSNKTYLPLELANISKNEQQQGISDRQQNAFISSQREGNGISNNVIAKAKPNKLRLNRIINRIESEKCKETVSKEFTQESGKEQMQTNNRYLSSHLESICGSSSAKVQQMKFQIQRIQRLSGYQRNAKLDPARDGGYKSPFDMLQSIRQKRQQLQQQIMQSNEPHLRKDTAKVIQKQTHQEINNSNQPAKIDKQLIQELVHAMKQAQQLQTSPLSIHQKVEIQSHPPISQFSRIQSQQLPPLNSNMSVEQTPPNGPQQHPKRIFNVQPQYNIHQQIQKSTQKQKEINRTNSQVTHQKPNSTHQPNQNIPNTVCDVIYITPPHSHKTEQPTQRQKTSKLHSEYNIDSNQSHISPHTYVNIFIPPQQVENEDQLYRRAKRNNDLLFQQSKFSHQSALKPLFTAQQTVILKKCVFQSKSCEEEKLITMVKSFNSKQGAKLYQLTRNNSYFMNRHIILSTCSYNEKVVCYCLSSPYLTPQSRYVFLLHLEIINGHFLPIAPQLIATFIKYILYNDPAGKLIYLRLRHIFEDNYAGHFQQIKSYSGAIKTPLKSPSFEEVSYLFERRDLKCNKSEDYSTIFNTIALFVTTKNANDTLSTPNSKEVRISSSYLKKVQAVLKTREVNRFASHQLLSKYLQSEHLPHFRQYEPAEHLLLYSMILEDCLVKARYFVHLNYFYFTIEPPFAYFCEAHDLYYLLLATSLKNKFYLLADKIYDESEHIDMHKSFKDHVLNRRLADVFMNDKMTGKIVGCPKFHKKVEFKVTDSTSGIILFELNWKQYLKGARYLRQEAILVELIGPFLCALVEIGEDGIIRHIYSTVISKDNLQK